MNKIINTNSFVIHYIDKKLDYQTLSNNYIILEIYRSRMYKKLKKKLKKKFNIQYDNIKNKNQLFEINNKDNFVTYPLLLDIMSIFIMNHIFNSKLDPIFDNHSPFKKSLIKKYFKNRCIPTLTDNVILSIIEILPKISKTYKKYYVKINEKIKILNDIKYEIKYEIIQKTVFIYLQIENNIILGKNFKYNNILPISLHIFQHLIKLFNTKVLNNFTSNDILDVKVIEYIYMIFNRYNMISSGNNQASLLPSFKKILKDKLNIKVELFGSPINTSTSNFGSIFYDIEHVFGSIGNIFDTKIQKGYYEVNPIFDKCLIDKLLNKCTKELIEAQINKNQLLFLFILPYSFFRYSNIPHKMNKYIKYSIILQKEEFPYIRYNRDYTETNVSPIVITRLIICHTSHINDYVKYNVENFTNIINNWKK